MDLPASRVIVTCLQDSSLDLCRLVSMFSFTRNKGQKNDIIIALMGPTGCGKSTFINRAAGENVVDVGHDLESCTSTIQSIPVRHPTQDVDIVFVDTPGFNNTYLDDSAIRTVLAKWLKRLHESGTKLTGIIYIQDISHACMFGASLKSLEMFAGWCEDEAITNVTLATTKWRLADRKGEERERKLKERCWMLDHGATLARFEDTKESAWTIVDEIIKKGPIDAGGTEGGVKESMILVLSQTGAGKSTFINVTVGEPVAQVGHGLETCTSTVSPFVVKHRSLGDRRIVLVDTPGFDDTRENDLQSLNLIIEWLKSLEKRGLKLSGIVYLHDISQSRIETAYGSIKLLRSLHNRPDDAATNLVIATTKWSQGLMGEGQEREAQLRGKYWKDLFEKGAKYHRFKGDTDSAWNIVDLVPLDRQIVPRVIREELEMFRSGLQIQAGNAGLWSLLKNLLGLNNRK